MKAYIPYKGYYSSPYSRWQGSFQNENSIVLAANTSKRWLASKKWDPMVFDYLILGVTIGQPWWFYSSPWAASLMGMGGFDNRGAALSTMTISQACTTGVTCLNQAAMGIETGLYKNVFVLTTDRCSNGQHAVWPNPNGPGGQVISEDWLMDMFGKDPWAGNAMIKTAEDTAKSFGMTKEDSDAIALRRYEQYRMSLANDREFQKRYMFPVEIQLSKKKTIVVDADEGISPTTKEGLASLKPALPGGVVSFGAQTHPADGNTALVVTTRDKAKELGADPKVEIECVSYGFSRAKKGFMAMAPVPAAQMALDKAGLIIKDIKTIKTHNPFSVNDFYMAKTMNIDVMSYNNYGSSLVFGHPQGPTAARCIIEGIEETVIKGGGYLLFTGCAAGDCGASMIFKIS
jgi:acetyl-CoA C-acetyltransferase